MIARATSIEMARKLLDEYLHNGSDYNEGIKAMAELIEADRIVSASRAWNYVQSKAKFKEFGMTLNSKAMTEAVMK
jgi:hypothetical protein